MRICATPGCGTQLNSYNAQPLCSRCQGLPKLKLNTAPLRKIQVVGDGCRLHGHADWYEPKRRCRICEAEKQRRKRGYQ